MDWLHDGGRSMAVDVLLAGTSPGMPFNQALEIDVKTLRTIAHRMSTSPQRNAIPRVVVIC